MEGRLENEIKVNNYLQTVLKTMPDYVGRWFLKLKASDHQIRTCQSYIMVIKKYLESIDKHIKNITIEQLDSLSVDKYMISIQTKTNREGNVVYTSASHQKTVWSALNNFFGFLEKEKLIEQNYMRNIDRTKESDEERINENRILLTKEDFNKIMDSINRGVGSNSSQIYQEYYKNRNKAIFLLFMTTGMRREEIREINVSDIDFEEKKLSIVIKGKRRRILSLSDIILDQIQEWLYDREFLPCEEEDALFVNRYGKRMTGQAIYDLVDKFSEDALGYHISPHKLRSGFCSILLEEWGDIHAVMKAVGHKRVETTLRYAVTKNNEQEEASNLIGSFLDI